MITQGVVELWKQKLLNQGERRGEHRGRVREARAALRRGLARRKLVLSPAEDERIERCTNLTTLERWHEQAIDAKSATSALR